MVYLSANDDIEEVVKAFALENRKIYHCLTLCRIRLGIAE